MVRERNQHLGSRSSSTVPRHTWQAKKEGKRGPKVVHLVRNLPPLPCKLVEMIQEKSFVEFAWFPVFDEGPKDGDWRSTLHEGGDHSPTRQASSSRKRGPKEIPDVSWWGTCFTLFQAAWAKADPSMWAPLSAYREIIVRMAR